MSQQTLQAFGDMQKTWHASKQQQKFSHFHFHSSCSLPPSWKYPLLAGWTGAKLQTRNGTQLLKGPHRLGRLQCITGKQAPFFTVGEKKAFKTETVVWKQRTTVFTLIHLIRVNTILLKKRGDSKAFFFFPTVVYRCRALLPWMC